MADLRNVRRSAERAARELMSVKLALVGDLGAAQMAQATATGGVDEARAEGRALVDRARQEGDRLVTQARRAAEETAAQYAETYAAAVAGGWTPDDLLGLGYSSPPRTRRRPEAAGRERADGDGGSSDPAAGES